MSALNKKLPAPQTETHGGATVRQNKDSEEMLRRSVMSNLLWERSFYEEGVEVADRIRSLIPQVDAQRCAEIAIEARTLWKLRHVPLLIVREMARLETHRHLVARTLEQVIQRPDECGEFLSLYWAKGKEKLSAQVKKGLAAALRKFDAYQLAKWNQDGAVKLRDVLFLTHARPEKGLKGFTKAKRKLKGARWPQDEGSKLYRGLVENTLPVPETWETMLSAGKDKKASWTKLITEKKIPQFALIKNLRNMEQAGVDHNLINGALAIMKTDKILPFRFLVSAKHAPRFLPQIEDAFFRAMGDRPKLPGKTVLVIDVSGSMYGSPISNYSDADRVTVASSLAVLVRESCENPVIYATAGYDHLRTHATALVPAHRGFGLANAVQAMKDPLGGGGIFLKQVMDFVYDKEKSADRIIVITDEQDCSHGSADSPDKANAFGKHNYIINVSADRNGIGYGKWTHISGWSEAVLDFIRIFEEGRNAPRPETKKVEAPNAQSDRKAKTHSRARAHVSGSGTVHKRKRTVSV